MDKPILSIIIVTWNVESCIKACLESVEKATSNFSSEIIVIDNASSDRTIELIKNQYPYTKIIQLKSNIGFPAANNIGIKRADGKFILLLNPDTIVNNDSIKKMLEYLKSHPDVELVGPRTFDAYGKDQADAARRNPTLIRILLQSLGIIFLLPKSGFFDSLRICITNRDHTFEVDMVSGACMMFSEEMPNKIGYLDEEIFLNAEDIDYCYRVWKSGYRIVFLHDAEIIHLKEQSRKQVPIFSREIDFVANNYFFIKHLGPFAALNRRLIWIPGALLRIFVFSLFAILKKNSQRQIAYNNVIAYTRILMRLIGIRRNKLEPV